MKALVHSTGEVTKPSSPLAPMYYPISCHFISPCCPMSICSLPQVEVPKALIESEKLTELLRTSPPAFVPVPPSTSAAMLAAAAGETPDWPLRQYDEATGVIQRRLSNGIRVNLKITANEAKGGILRLVVPGGRARDDPQTAGTVSVGVRTLSESGRVGDLSREQVSKEKEVKKTSHGAHVECVVACGRHLHAQKVSAPPPCLSPLSTTLLPPLLHINAPSFLPHLLLFFTLCPTPSPSLSCPSGLPNCPIPPPPLSLSLSHSPLRLLPRWSCSACPTW